VKRSTSPKIKRLMRRSEELRAEKAAETAKAEGEKYLKSDEDEGVLWLEPDGCAGGDAQGAALGD
jgi:hypothetical protein